MPRHLSALALVAALAASPRPAQADPRLELARSAPFHGLLEVVQGAAAPHAVAEPCRLEVVVRQPYRGGAALPAGRRVTIALGCLRTPLPDEAEPPLPEGIGGLDVRHLAAGSLVEAYLRPAPPGGPLPTGGFTVPRLLAVPSLSEAPRDALPPPGAVMPAGGWPGRPRPLDFPARDVVVTFRTSTRPGETFLASYSAGPRPAPMVRVERLGTGAERDGATLYEPGADRALRVWTAPPRSEILPMAREERAGRLTANPDAFFTAEGDDRVAGLPCTRWRIEDLLRRVPAELACVTEDGVILRRTDATGTTEALQVAYGPRDRARFAPLVPDHIR